MAFPRLPSAQAHYVEASGKPSREFYTWLAQLRKGLDGVLLAENDLSDLDSIPITIFNLGLDRHFDTRAAAIAATISSGVNVLYLGGYAAAGDGGFATYKRLGSTPSPSKPWHLQSADGAWWQLAPFETINARQLGVTADGVTNDAAAVQAVFDILRSGVINSTYTGGMALFPPGRINLGSTGIVHNYGATVSGTGQGFTQPALYPTTNANATVFVSTKTSGKVLEFHTKNPVVLSNFQIEMVGSNNTVTGIYIDKYDPTITTPPATTACNFNSRISNITTTGGGYGIHCLDCAGFQIFHCYIQNFAQAGIWMENDAEAPDSGDGSIHDCHLQCFYHDQGTGVLLDQVGGIALHDCKILGAAYGIQYRASIAGASGGGELDVHDMNIEDSGVNGFRLTQTGAGANAGGINILDCHFNCGAVGFTFQSAIAFISNGSASYLTRSKIEGNDILFISAAPGSNAIDIETGTNITVSGNTYQIPSDCYVFGTSAEATNVVYQNNGRPGVTSPFNSLVASTWVQDRFGIPFTNLGAWANGSLVYVTDGRATTTTNLTVIGGGSGIWACRVQNGWYAMHPFVT